MAAGDITTLLHRMAGEVGPARKQTYDELVQLVYDDLRRRARHQVRRERADSVGPTVLVHEAYERLLGYRMSFVDRGHFFAVAATAMRRYLIERARKVRAARRGGGRADDTLDAAMAAGAMAVDAEVLLDVDRALGRLTPEQTQLTELRFFAGYTLEEAAAIMGLQPETAKKRWRVVKARLMDELTSDTADGA